MSEIREGSLGEILRRRLLISGQDQPPSDLSNEIAPVIVLESDRPEWKYLSGEHLAMGVASITAIAAEFQQIQLFNPANSGVIGVLQHINCGVDASQATSPGIRYFDGALGVAVNEVVTRDRRWDGPAGGTFRRPMLQLRTLSSGTQFGTIFAFLDLAGYVGEVNVEFSTYYVWNEPIILNPNTGLTISPAIVNRTIFASMTWRERSMTAWEQPVP